MCTSAVLLNVPVILLHFFSVIITGTQLCFFVIPLHVSPYTPCAGDIRKTEYGYQIIYIFLKKILYAFNQQKFNIFRSVCLLKIFSHLKCFQEVIVIIRVIYRIDTNIGRP